MTQPEQTANRGPERDAPAHEKDPKGTANAPEPDSDLYLSAPELCGALSISRATLARAVKDGLPVIGKSQRLKRFHLQTVLRWWRRHR